MEVSNEDDISCPPSFNCTEEELHYWKKKAFQFKKGLEDLKKDFEEYEEDSKTLEMELDTQLKQYESKNKELINTVNRASDENSLLRMKLADKISEYDQRMAEWTEEVSSFRKTGDEVNRYVRELEQKNDDLERANRAAAVSIEDFEVRLNHAIERNAILESELDEKESLKAMVQRLKDETKDLRYELQVKKQPDGREVHKVDSSVATTPCSTPFSFGRLTSSSTPNGTPTTNSSRMSPLAIVNDLLRKVGALESKLQNYNRKENKKLTSLDSKNHQNNRSSNTQQLDLKKLQLPKTTVEHAVRNILTVTHPLP